MDTQLHALILASENKTITSTELDQMFVLIYHSGFREQFGGYLKKRFRIDPASEEGESYASGAICTLIECVKNRRFEVGGSWEAVKGWLFRVATNNVMKELRRKKHLTSEQDLSFRFDEDGDNDSEWANVPGTDDFLSDIFHKELMKQIERRYEKMDAKYEKGCRLFIENDADPSEEDKQAFMDEFGLKNGDAYRQTKCRVLKELRKGLDLG